MLPPPAQQFYYRNPARGGLIDIRTAYPTGYQLIIPAGWAEEDAVARPLYVQWAAANATQNGNGLIGQLGISRQNAIQTVRTAAQIAAIATGGVLLSEAGSGTAATAATTATTTAATVPTTTATLSIGGNVVGTVATGQSAVLGGGSMSAIGGALDSIGLGTLGTNLDAMLTAAGTQAAAKALGLAPQAQQQVPLAQLGTGTGTGTGTSTGIDMTTMLMLAAVAVVAFLALKKG